MITRISLFCTRRTISTSQVRRDSVWDRVRDFVFATEKENFHADYVRRAYKWDKVDRKEWKLIYKDVGATRSYFLVATLLPISVVGATVLLLDRFTKPPSERFNVNIRLERDFKELGYLAIFPSIALVLVVVLLIRVNSTRILRFYQNRKNVDEFIAVRTKAILSQEKMKFHRDVAGAFYYNEDKEVQKMFLHFLFGNIQIEKRKFLIIDECFLGNNYRSFMLNETNVPPRLISQSDKVSR